ncbi:MAG: hypothetical protein AB7F38_04735 [Piscinibacter sp.]
MDDQTSTSSLARIKHWHAYQEARADIWRTRPAFDWFLRRNRARLVKAGALVMIRGAWHVDPEVFDAEVLAIAREDAASWIDREAGKAAA